MSTHSRILAGITLWTEEPGRLQSMELAKESDKTEHTCMQACIHRCVHIGPQQRAV